MAPSTQAPAQATPTNTVQQVAPQQPGGVQAVSAQAQQAGLHGERMQSASELPPGGNSGAAGPSTSAGAPATSSAQSSMRGVAAAAFADAEREAGGVQSVELDPDLVLARTVLAGILAVSPAVEPLRWAVSVVRPPDIAGMADAGPQVFVTSNEGRGWIPAGVFLPRDVLSPWTYGPAEVAARSVAWEFVEEPGRVLIEHALLCRDRYVLKALATSAPSIPSSYRTAFPGAAFTTVINGDGAKLDLSALTEYTADRLQLADPDLAAEVDRLPVKALAAEGFSIAWDADAQLTWTSTTTLPNTESPVTAATMRRSILDTMNRNRQSGATAAPESMWSALKALDGFAAALGMGRRFDAERVDLGALKVNDGTFAVPAARERRANEALLLCNGEWDHQRLRDCLYAYKLVRPVLERDVRPAPVGASA